MEYFGFNDRYTYKGKEEVYEIFHVEGDILTLFKTILRFFNEIKVNPKAWTSKRRRFTFYIAKLTENKNQRFIRKDN